MKKSTICLLTALLICLYACAGVAQPDTTIAPTDTSTTSPTTTTTAPTSASTYTTVTTTDPAYNSTTASTTVPTEPTATTEPEPPFTTSVIPSSHGRLSEESIRALFAWRNPGAAIIGVAMADFDYVFYTENGSHVKIDCYNATTGKCSQADVLGGYEDMQDIRIYGYYAEPSGSMDVYMGKPFDMPEVYANLPVYPARVRFFWDREKAKVWFSYDNDYNLNCQFSASFFLPLEMSGYYHGLGAEVILNGYRTDYASISLAVRAIPGAPTFDGNEVCVLSRADYDAQANALVLTLKNTSLAESFEAIGTPNEFIKSVSAVASGDDVVVTVALADGVSGYAEEYDGYSRCCPDSDVVYTGVLRITFSFGSATIVPLP